MDHNMEKHTKFVGDLGSPDPHRTWERRETKHQPQTSDVRAAKKLRIVGLCLLGYIVVVLTNVMMHYVLPPVSTQPQTCLVNISDAMTPAAEFSSTSEKKLTNSQVNSTEVPLGTILAWIPSPNRDWIPEVPIPKGWHICNGSVILDNASPWIGQYSPNLTERFLRGGDMSNFLNLQEDQIQDHEHIDGGHTHVDQGHSHNDTGHTHEDLGHTHTDTGHTHVDAGHDHSYQTPSYGQIEYENGQEHSKATGDPSTTGVSQANIQSASAVLTTDSAILSVSSAAISTNQANLMNATSNLRGVDPETRGARIGDETRPKAMYIIYIMKVANHD